RSRGSTSKTANTGELVAKDKGGDVTAVKTAQRVVKQLNTALQPETYRHGLVCNGASSSGQQEDEGQGQGEQEVIAERRQVIKAAFRGLVEAAQPDLSPEEVDAVVEQANQRMTMGSMQCCLAAVMSLTMLLQSFLGQPTPGFPAAGPAPCPPPPPDPACPPYSHPRLPTRCSPRSAAPPAQLPPPVQLDVEDPSLLPQIKAAMDLLTNASVQEHLMRGPHHSRCYQDTNPCLNFQRIGESMQRPLELCRWTDLKALPPVGKEYQQGYKLVNDRLPKVRQRLHRAAEYRRGIDGRARNNAGIAETRECEFNPGTQIGVGTDPSFFQAVSAASGVWDERSGQLVADQLARWKLTKGQVKHASGLNNSRRDIERWLAPIKKLEKDMAELSMKRHGHAKQLVVFFGAAGIGTGGGWGADAVLRACRKVVYRPRGKDQRRGKVVLVDEHRTTRVSSTVSGKQPCEEELDHEQPTRRADWEPPAGQADLRLLRPAWSQQPKRSKRTEAEQAAEPSQPAKGEGKGKGKPAPQPGRWLNRDCNAALNMQRIDSAPPA
ncbi:hypothetical protein QJQ45_015168, partial [Haematococcus lacustris]